MANIKSICSILILTTVLCCGCDNASTSSPVSSAGTTSATKSGTTNVTTSGTAEADSSQHSQAQIQSEETSETGSTYEPGTEDFSNYPYWHYWITLEAEYKYEDDTVPENWLPIYTAAEALSHFDELTNASTSGGDVSEAITLLVNRNVIFFETQIGHTYAINWDEKYTPEGSEMEFHPITLRYYSDIDSISRLAYNTYRSDVADEFLFGKENARQLFMEKNGQPYVNVNAMTIWSADPFIARSYIEILETTDDRCTFIWHYPDIEGLNEPTDYKYHYFENKYSASFVDGAWVLNTFILNNGISE